MKRTYDFDPKTTPERIIAIYHDRSYYDEKLTKGYTDKELTSSAWDMLVSTVINNDYVVSCVNGEVKGVYAIVDYKYSDRQRARVGKNANTHRIELVLSEEGRCMREMRRRYLGKISKAYHRPYVSTKND